MISDMVGNNRILGLFSPFVKFMWVLGVIGWDEKVSDVWEVGKENELICVLVGVFEFEKQDCLELGIDFVSSITGYLQCNW